MSAELWTRAQESLDERRDPLADAELRALLLEHPEEAPALCELRDGLRALESAQIPLRAARRSRFVPLAAAAALAGVALLGWGALRPLDAAAELERHPIVAAPQLGRVVEWSTAESTETAAGTRTLRVHAGRVEIESDFHTPDGALAQASVLAIHEESWSPR